MRNISVLVINDNEFVAKSLKNNLEKSEYDVTTVLSGENAIKKLHNTSFDLVITELVTQGPNGIEILIRAKKINPGACVFILCDHGPYDADRLLLKIERYLERQESLKNNRQTAFNSFLTICRECKKIRDDTGNNIGDGEWRRLEVFLNNHCGGVDTSPGYCPTCSEKYTIIDIAE